MAGATEATGVTGTWLTAATEHAALLAEHADTVAVHADTVAVHAAMLAEHAALPEAHADTVAAHAVIAAVLEAATAEAMRVVLAAAVAMRAALAVAAAMAAADIGNTGGFSFEKARLLRQAGFFMGLRSRARKLPETPRIIGEGLQCPSRLHSLLKEQN
jgi:hypothetical protein